ncbi:MAG: hypothetical protein IT547_17320 [Hyphomonadaceae bacterium]|nr:hypothetical protein [Hyphomonadaceae bacterium]
MNLAATWASFVRSATNVWTWLQIDSSEATLVKFGILLVVVFLLLLVLSDVYRGEIQNQNVTIDITSHENRFGYGDKDVVFTQQTFDIQSEKLPADVNLLHSFTIVDGVRRIDKRIVLDRRSARLRMVRTAHRVDHGQIALAPDIVLALKNRAEYLQRQELKRHNTNLWRRVRMLFAKAKDDATAEPHSYMVRIHFPLNPYFLLFIHPDKDVKATGWLTLLTSLFAVLTEFLF